MLDDISKRRRLAKWIIGIVTSCIVIYLAFRHIANITATISWMIGLARPLLVGTILALMLNVPMSFIEQRLCKKTKLRRGLRPLSIVLALFLVIGIVVGISVLVIPELIDAITLIIQIASEGLDQLAKIETDAELLETPLGVWLADLNIDWVDLKNRLQDWFQSQSGTFVNQAVGAAGSMISYLVTFIVGLVFAIYSLSSKEKLKNQFCRLIRVWLPEHFGNNVIHVASICSDTFRLFIAGQATEAIILGTLCMIGMAILRIPYAPMIGALVGVTALIPIVGAFVGTIVGAIMILTVNPFKALIFVAFLLILQQVEGNMIYPRVVGSKIRLPAMWVLAAVTIGGNLGGPIGMLLGVPAASAAYALLKEATDIREKKKFLGKETPTK